MDHKIPQCIGGPNEPWNLWSLCLRDHRLKCRLEQKWLIKNEKRCFACQKIVSKYFCDSFWCSNCQRFDMSVRIHMLEKFLIGSIQTLQTQNG